MPCSPSTAKGRDAGLIIEKSPSQKESLHRSEMPCVCSPEADDGAWAGTSPAAQSPGAVTHLLKAGTSFWGRRFPLDCLTPEDTTTEKYASLADGQCMRGQVRTETCLYLYRRAVLRLFHFSRTLVSFLHHNQQHLAIL